MVEKIVKPKALPVENTRNAEDIDILSEKRQEMLNQKICKLLKNSTVLKFVTRKWIEVKVDQAVNILLTRM